MSSPIVRLVLLVLLGVLLVDGLQADDWLDGRFETAAINVNSFSPTGSEADQQFKLKQKAADEVASVVANRVASVNSNEVTDGLAGREIIRSASNATNRIEDFELNSRSGETTGKGAAAVNATLAKQPRLFSLNLDKDGLLTLFWTVNAEQRHILFELKLSLPNQVNAPFLAFGFSAYGGFENADLCVLWNDDQGKFHFQDTWTDANGFINLDKQNDCELLSTKRVGNQIYLLFKRKFNTCDSHDFKLTKGTNHLLYALGNGQLEAVYGLRLASIKRKGFTRVSLFKSKQIPPLLNPGMATLLLGVLL